MAQQKSTKNSEQVSPLGYKIVRFAAIVAGLMSLAAIIGPFWIVWALDDWASGPTPVSFYAKPILFFGLPFLIAAVYLWRLADRTKKNSI